MLTALMKIRELFGNPGWFAYHFHAFTDSGNPLGLMLGSACFVATTDFDEIKEIRELFVEYENRLVPTSKEKTIQGMVLEVVDAMIASRKAKGVVN